MLERRSSSNSGVCLWIAEKLNTRSGIVHISTAAAKCGYSNSQILEEGRNSARISILSSLSLFLFLFAFTSAAAPWLCPHSFEATAFLIQLSSTLCSNFHIPRPLFGQFISFSHPKCSRLPMLLGFKFWVQSSNPQLLCLFLYFRPEFEPNLH